MPKIWTTTRRLSFGDCDVSGTGYYPAYFNMLNGVNEEFWGFLGFPWEKIIINEGWGTPTVHLSSDFAAPSKLGDTLGFSLVVRKIATSSITLSHSVNCGDEPRWSAQQVLVASDFSRHVSIPWPDAFRDAVAPYLEAVD